MNDAGIGRITDIETPEELRGSEEHTYDDSVEVRRDGALSLVVGVLAGAVTGAYLWRALSSGSGSPLEWLVVALVGAVAVVHLVAVADARAPLMVLDHHGVRVRAGRTWQGVAWPEVERVEHLPRQTMLRDGRLIVVDVEGRSLEVRLSLSTRLIGANWHELTEALLDLSEGRTEVFEEVAAGEVSEDDAVRSVPAVAISPTPAALRQPVLGRRSETVHESTPAPVVVQRVEEEPPAVSVLPARAEETATILIDQAVADPVADPVVGPQLASARTRLGLSVDQLADRTRIRPHVIEAIEVDDFAPCGGDFYARGHLRTLARILGVDAVPVLEAYDERYADAPIDPRQVFQAELATGVGGTIRGTRGGLSWSMLVAAVMAVVLLWSVAQLVTSGPVPLVDRPILNGSPGGKAALSSGGTAEVPVVITAAGGGAKVTVRSGSEVVFDEQLPFMQTAEIDVAPPIRITSSDGSLLVGIDGEDEGAIGQTGRTADQTYVP